jgi:hypothetical protein
MKNLKAIATTLFCLQALASCGGSDSGGDVTLGISSGKALSEVTPDEATRGCTQLRNEVQARFNPVTLKPKICTLVAVSFASDESSCTNLRDACVQDNSAGDDAGELAPAEDISCNGTTVDGWQGCTATVGEMEGCLNDMLDALDAMLSSYTCKDAGTLQNDCEPPPTDPRTGMPAIDPTTNMPFVDPCEDSGPFANLAPAEPASCRALQTKCPNIGLFDD